MPVSGRHDSTSLRHRQNVMAAAPRDRESALSRCEARRTSRTSATRPTIGTAMTAARNHTLPPLEDRHVLRSSVNLEDDDDDDTGNFHSSLDDSSVAATIHSQ